MRSFLAVIDPNWSADAGGGGRGAQNHYGLASPERIASEYGNIIDDGGDYVWPTHEAKCNALVFMWATAGALAMKENGNPPDAHVLARCLGLRVCASATWCKVDEVKIPESRHDEEWFTPPARMGLGQWLRVEDERLLICRRGELSVPEPAARPRSVIYAPRGKHSEKPEKAWTQVIEPIARSVMPGVVGVEFNARVQRKGWHAVGRLDGEDKPVRFARAA